MVEPLAKAGVADTAVAVQKKQGVHYAWFILSSTVAMSTIGAGLGFYSYSAFYKPWETEFGWSRGEISLVMSISGLLTGFLSPLFGRWTDKFGSRKVTLIGALIMGASYIVMAATGAIPPFVGALALPFLYLIFLIMALGRAGTSNIPISTLIANWFFKRRGLAMGIQSTGVGFGGVIIAPVMALLIAYFGWRVAFIFGGLLTYAVMIPLIAFVLRNRPVDKGLRPYGADEPGAGAADGRARKPTRSSAAQTDYPWTLGEAMRTVPFWCLGFGQGLFYVGNSTILQHAIPFFSEKGESTAVAAGMLSAIAGLGVIGKVASGYVVDKMPTARYVYLGSMIFQGVGIFILMLANSMPLYWFGVIVVGLSMGGAVALQAVMLGECFGIGSFGVLLGATSVVITVFSNLGPLYAGYMHDLTGNYQLALLTAVIGELIAGSVVFFAKPARPRPSLRTEG